MLKKILIGTGVTLVTLAALFLIVVGPWPVYSDSGFEESDYYSRAIADIDAALAESDITDSPGRLQAGWGTAIMTPVAGTPLGGYSNRGGAPSTGARDELYVKALALSDGQDTMVLVGSDMLLVPPNIADMVREAVGEQTPLTANDILFHASHTHCGPGGLAPGIAAKISFGPFDPAVPDFIADCFTEAIVEAWEDMEPAKLTHGAIDAPGYIRNRTRKGPVDSTLNYALVEQEDGDRCFLMRYSAHPTNYGGSMMQFSAEFPGELQRFIEAQTGATAIYLGGALGSMSSASPTGKGGVDRMAEMGEGLGKLVIKASEEAAFRDHIDIASFSIDVGMPPAQMRPLSPGWRISPIMAKLFGVPPEGRVQGGRAGDLMFIGLPYDMSGEISRAWQEAARREQYNLWCTGFSAAYCGYLSPDKYYNETNEDGHLDYETGLMSWFGPDQEAYMAALYNHALDVMGPAPVQTARKP
jgi:neutral ceramidase